MNWNTVLWGESLERFLRSLFNLTCLQNSRAMATKETNKAHVDQFKSRWGEEIQELGNVIWR